MTEFLPLNYLNIETFQRNVNVNVNLHLWMFRRLSQIDVCLCWPVMQHSKKSAFILSVTLNSSKGLFQHSGNCMIYPSTSIFPHTSCFHVSLHFSFPKTFVSTFRTKYLATALSFPLRDFCPLSMNNLLLALQVTFVLTSIPQSS